MACAQTRAHFSPFFRPYEAVDGEQGGEPRGAAKAAGDAREARLSRPVRAAALQHRHSRLCRRLAAPNRLAATSISPQSEREEHWIRELRGGETAATTRAMRAGGRRRLRGRRGHGRRRHGRRGRGRRRWWRRPAGSRMATARRAEPRRHRVTARRAAVSRAAARREHVRNLGADGGGDSG